MYLQCEVVDEPVLKLLQQGQLVKVAQFQTIRYTYSNNFYVDVIQLGTSSYSVCTLLQQEQDTKMDKKIMEIIDAIIWLPANSKIVEFICHERTNQRLMSWPQSPHEESYVSPEGLARFYTQSDPIFGLYHSSELQEQLSCIFGKKDHQLLLNDWMDISLEEQQPWESFVKDVLAQFEPLRGLDAFSSTSIAPLL